MSKLPFDPDALISMFESATAKQGGALRQAVTQATLSALQARELSLKNIKGTVKAVSEAASAGLAKNALPGVDPQAMLEQAVAGMDAALLKAVDANRVALQTLVQQGADLRDKHLKKAMDDLDHFEDTMMGAVKKAAATAGGPMADAWGQVLQKMQASGMQSGAQASATAEQLAEQMHGAMRSTRAASMRAAQAMAESYTAMVSGVLIGMSDALQGMAAAQPAAKKTAKK